MFLLTATASGVGANTGTITTMHLILIAVLIVLVIGAIVWGARQKSARVAGQEIEAERTEQMLAHPQTETAVSPAPPPLGDSGMNVPVAESALEPAKPKPVAKPKAAPKSATKAVAPKTAPVSKPAAKVAKAPASAPAAKEAKPTLATSPAPAKPAPAETPAPKPVAAAKAAPKPKPVPVPATPSQYGLIDVKGLGPKAVPLLEGLGVRTLSDLAGLSTARAAEVDGQLGVLSGRLTRDKWVDQAKLLATGDVTAFEATYGKL